MHPHLDIIKYIFAYGSFLMKFNIYNFAFLQVKLAHQESELVTLLKKIPLGPLEMALIRERAGSLRDGYLRLRGDALLPLMLASYIFESLVTTPNSNR